MFRSMPPKPTHSKPTKRIVNKKLLERCVDVIQYNGREMVSIKEPGSTRHSETGTAIKYIMMTREEARQLSDELQAAVWPNEGLK